MKTNLQIDNSRKSKSNANNLTSNNVQPKLRVGKPDDKYEQEAESTANRIMMMPESQIQRQEENDEEVQTKLEAQLQPVEEEDIQPKFMIQAQPFEEEEEKAIQTKFIVQKQNEEKEPVQASFGGLARVGEEFVQKKSYLQFQTEEEEEVVQTKHLIQRQLEEEEQTQTKSFLQKQTENEVSQTGNVWEEDKEKEKGFIQSKHYNSGRTSAGLNGESIENEINKRKGGGNPLPESTRLFMENRMGADFSKVRVHHDDSAARLSSQLNAQAFTTGNNIFFNTGKYNPETHSGKHLLAHELTHTVQQGAAIKQKKILRKPAASGSVFVQRGILDDIAGAASNIISIVSQTIGTGITTAAIWINAVTNFVGGGISGAWSWIRQTAATMQMGVRAAWDWVRNFASQVGMGIRNGFQWITGIARSIGSGVRSAWEWLVNLGRTIGRPGTSAWEWIRNIASTIGMGIRSAWGWVQTMAQRVGFGIIAAWNWLRIMAAELRRGIRQAFDWIVSIAILIGNAVVSAWNWLRRLATLVGGSILYAWTFIRNVVAALRMGFEQALAFLINLAINIGVGLIILAWNWIRSVAATARMSILAIYNLLRRIASIIGRTLVSSLNLVLNIAHRIGRQILAAWNWIVASAHRIGRAILAAWNFIVNIARRLAISVIEAVDWWLNAPSIEHETEKVAPDGSSNSRNNIGVGEVVNFTGNKTGRWTASGGTPVLQNTGTNLRWTAPNRAANIRISLESGKYTNHVNLNIREPNSITARKKREIGIPRGTQGAGMKLDFNYHPKNVSFNNLMAREVSGPATNIEGYYLDDGGTFYHNSGDTFFNIDTDNSLEPDIEDTASQRGYPSPWYRGSFRWIIPNRFKVKTENGDGKEFTRVTQAFNMIDSTGKTKVTKAGAEVERTP